MNTLSLNPTTQVGPIRVMHAVNNGPAKPNPLGQSASNFKAYRDAHIPYARVHDANLCYAYGGPHTVDITAVFPNFDADETDPASYDFVHTDLYLQTIADAGTEVFFRLGQSIEHNARKYGIYPPKDVAKWARICEHIVRHCTEGWANGLHLTITYWEIWNEPDLYKHWIYDPNTQVDPTSPTWGGTFPQFFDLFETTAKHLKHCFPHLKIGGPAACSINQDFSARFLAEMKARGTPLDFFSWHRYATEPKQIADLCFKARHLLDEAGYSDTESIQNEWNYVSDFAAGWIPSLEVESGRFNQKAAAFVAASMALCQDAPVDMMMYYDARIGTSMNGLFNPITRTPMRPYYSIYAWSKLYALGQQFALALTQPEDDPLPHDLYATGAISADGARRALLIARYSDDNNVILPKSLRIELPEGCPFSDLRCHLTDHEHIYTEVPLDLESPNVATLELQPNSFALLEW